MLRIWTVRPAHCDFGRRLELWAPDRCRTVHGSDGGEPYVRQASRQRAANKIPRRTRHGTSRSAKSTRTTAAAAPADARGACDQSADFSAVADQPGSLGLCRRALHYRWDRRHSWTGRLRNVDGAAGNRGGREHHTKPARPQAPGADEFDALRRPSGDRPARPPDQRCPPRATPQRPRHPPGQARSAALFQLAAELPAALLARRLGIHIDVAVAWQRASSATG
jgi:hypothetical protein